MFRRIWLFLRELIWTAVGSLALTLIAIVSALIGADFSIVLSVGLGAIALAVLATRS